MSLQSYREFLNQADSHFEHVQRRFQAQFKCRSGCDDCCQTGLTVSSIERDNIRDFLLSRPALLTQIRHSVPDRSKCEFLSSDGACQIYPVRPFVCRSHGAPIAIAEDGYYRIDVCALNFQSHDIETLPPEDFFILDEWNACLTSYGSAARYPLTPSGIVDGEPLIDSSQE